MSDTQTVDNVQPKLPTVQQFVEAVKGQLVEWQQSNVEGLCHSQTGVVIEALVEYYQTEDEPYLVPDVETFKQVIRDFQEQKERATFAELTEPEVTELIVLVAPLYHASAQVATEEQAVADTSDTSNGDLDKHPF